MATLALAAAGASIGGALLPSGLSILGATASGAAIGSQIGAVAGSFIDSALFGASGQSRLSTGPRLSDLRVTASTEGAPIPRVYGAARVGGQIIWASDVVEEITTSSGSGSGKGVARSGSAAAQAEYRYYANFAVALAEGEITGLGRLWVDGQELDMGSVTSRLYLGSEDQEPDDLISAHVGAGAAPAYRGVAYIVFERLPLAPYGNRLPQMSFEVFRAVDDFNRQVRGVVLIPGCGEFAYAPTEVTRREVGGLQVAENVHTRQGGTDWSVAVDQLQATLPNCRSVSLVTCWFGTDLRADHCKIHPGVELSSKRTSPLTWQVAGLSRGDARVVSRHEGRPAYGGTPSDETVIAAIRDLKERGLSVTLAPFLLMDIPADNDLADPYQASERQPPYPWRGRVTVDPAPGQPVSPDKSPAAASQIATFVGSASAADYTIAGDTVHYSGPDEWSYRRFILHYAHLAKAAGGVDAFLIGSEMRGLTQARSAASEYPFVAALAALAGDVRAVLGPETKITYAADWSEYFGHHPQDGSGDVHFNLDPLWASPDIDAVGIDLYWPLSDWRDGRDHLDALSGVPSIYDPAYLGSNVAGGEGYDWYYASDADRTSQVRTPISDGSGKPWVFRFKDIRSWWENPHFDRPGGIETGTPTAWVPRSKPIWLMEVGCPAVDKGSNQPNVFVDPKSSETALPRFSSGRRDDYMQRCYLQTIIAAFDPDHPPVPDANPVSDIYGSRMVDVDRIHVYAWDARPYPAFPNASEIWGDGANWRRGHWITGRIAGAPLNATVAKILDDAGFSDHETTALDGLVPGFTIDRLMSPREALQPLEMAYFFDAVESGGRIVFRPRGDGTAIDLSADDLVETRAGGDILRLTRAQETELPGSAKILYAASDSDYRPAVAEARRLAAASSRVAQAELAIAMSAEQAAGIADSWLFEAWAARERASFVLPPSRLALEPSDVVRLVKDGRSHLFRITAIGDHGAREIDALSLDPELYALGEGAARQPRPSPAAASGQPAGYFLDLPALGTGDLGYEGYFAATQIPWPGAVALFRSPSDTGFTLQTIVRAPAVTGLTVSPLSAGPIGRFDHAGEVVVELEFGELESKPQLLVLAGGNSAAVRSSSGLWEVLQFQSATLIAPSTYRLTRLLRGQMGSDGEMQETLPAGTPFVLLSTAVARVDIALHEIGLPLTWRFGPASRDVGRSDYVSVSHAFRGVGLRPLSPVHVRGARNSEGDIFLSWVRRTRVGGDGWDGIEVPLGEEREAYEVDILDESGLVRRVLKVSGPPAVAYTAEQQMEDFGSLPSQVRVRVSQISAIRGRGAPRTATI